MVVSVWSELDPHEYYQRYFIEGWSRKAQLGPLGCDLSNARRFWLSGCFTLCTAHHSLMAQQVLTLTALLWMLKKRDLFSRTWGRIQTTAQENNFTTTPQGGVFLTAGLNNKMFHLTFPCPMASCVSSSVQNSWMFWAMTAFPAQTSTHFLQKFPFFPANSCTVWNVSRLFLL